MDVTICSECKIINLHSWRDIQYDNAEFKKSKNAFKYSALREI